MDENRKKDLMEKAFRLGFDYEQIYRGCSQCTIAAVQDTLDIREDNVFKAAAGLAAGGGLTGIGVCGGYAGSIMMISWLCGRERTIFSRTLDFPQPGPPVLDTISPLTYLRQPISLLLPDGLWCKVTAG
jgi:hypothetical protein